MRGSCESLQVTVPELDVIIFVAQRTLKLRLCIQIQLIMVFNQAADSGQLVKNRINLEKRLQSVMVATCNSPFSNRSRECHSEEHLDKKQGSLLENKKI